MRAPAALVLGGTLVVACGEPKPDCEPDPGVYQALFDANNDADGLIVPIVIEADDTFRSEFAFRDNERGVDVDAVIEGTFERLCGMSGWDSDLTRPCTPSMSGRWQGSKGEGDWSATCREIGDDGDYYDLQYSGTWATIP